MTSSPPTQGQRGTASLVARDERPRTTPDAIGNRPSTARDRFFKALIAVETVIAVVLGAITIGQRSLWLDESVSATFARAGFHKVLQVFLTYDANMSLYNAMLVIWQHVGASEAALRSMSLLCVATTVPFVALIGRRLFGRTTGLVAGGIMSLSPFAVRYAQEARSYGLVMLLVTLSSYCLLRALDSGWTAYWLVYAIVAAAACYAQDFAVFVIVANVVVVALGPIPVKNRRAVVEAAGVFGLLLIPIGLASAEHGTGQIRWIKDPTIGSVKFQLVRLAGNRGLALIFGLLCLGTIVLGLRAWHVRRCRADAWPYAFVTAWWAVPIIGALVVSVLSTPIFISRYLSVALPWLALASAACVSRLPRPIGVVVLSLVVAASAVGIAHQYDRPNENFRDAEAYVARTAGTDDGIVICPTFDWT